MTWNKHNLNPQDVAAVYNETHSQQKTGKHFGVTAKVIKRILEENNIPKLDWREHRHKQWKEIIAAYQSGKSMNEVADEFNCSWSWVGLLLNHHGIEARPVGASTTPLTEQQQEQILTMWDEGKAKCNIAQTVGITVRNLTKFLILSGRYVERRVARGEKHHNWTGGFKKMNGYRFVLCPDEFADMCLSSGYVAEHRLAMARHLGRSLLRRETVHHINGDKLDNRIENLQMRIGNHGKGEAFKCNCCGSCDISPVPLMGV